MKQQSIVFGLVGLVIGSLITGFIMANRVNTQSQISTDHSVKISPTNISEKPEDLMANMDHDQTSMDQMSMSDMNNALEGITGDEFDKTFIQAMIGHHQGAIDMANIAKQSAKHQEIKDLSEDIITAQQNEIKMMSEWQKNWGYTQ